MTHRGPEARLAAMREEIRHAAWVVDNLRSIPWIVALALIVLAEFWPVMGPLRLAALVLALIGVAVSGLRRPLHRAHLRRKLAQLSPDEQRAVLTPLDAHGSDELREFIQPLVRQLPFSPNVVSPASTPHSRGDEATPAE